MVLKSHSNQSLESSNTRVRMLSFILKGQKLKLALHVLNVPGPCPTSYTHVLCALHNYDDKLAAQVCYICIALLISYYNCSDIMSMSEIYYKNKINSDEKMNITR